MLHFISDEMIESQVTEVTENQMTERQVTEVTESQMTERQVTDYMKSMSSMFEKYVYISDQLH